MGRMFAAGRASVPATARPRPRRPESGLDRAGPFEELDRDALAADFQHADSTPTDPVVQRRHGEGIAPLVREMWIAGIETHMSCQEDGGDKVWIAFPDICNM